MSGHPAVAGTGEARKAREDRGGESPAAQLPEQSREGLAGRAARAVGGNDVHGRHPLGGVEIGEESLGLGTLQRDRPQPLRAVEAQQPREQPFAKTAVSVVEDEPGLALGRRWEHSDKD